MPSSTSWSRSASGPHSQVASLDQLKVAQAQLLGWVNGVVLARATLGTLAQVDADDASVLLGAISHSG